jgi:hypothetical protein
MITEMLEVGKGELAGTPFVIATGEEREFWLKGPTVERSSDVPSSAYVHLQRLSYEGADGDDPEGEDPNVWTTWKTFSGQDINFIVSARATYRFFRPEQGSAIGVDEETE